MVEVEERIVRHDRERMVERTVKHLFSSVMCTCFMSRKVAIIIWVIKEKTRVILIITHEIMYGMLLSYHIMILQLVGCTSIDGLFLTSFPRKLTTLAHSRHHFLAWRHGLLS